jgi:hypothetical protein
MWYVVLTFKDDIFRSDFMRSFMQFQIGADPGFQVREAHLKKLRRAEGSAPGTSIQKLINIDRRKLVEILVWYVVLTFKDDIFRSDFMRSFMQFQHHNITSDK